MTPKESGPHVDPGEESSSLLRKSYTKEVQNVIDGVSGALAAQASVPESSHLREGIDPIDRQMVHGEEEIEAIMEGAIWLDYDGGDLEELAREGGKHAGTNTYIISPIDERDVFADKYLDCTGVLVIGRDAQTGQEISFVSHQDPKFFIDGGDTRAEQFAKDLSGSMEEMNRRSLEGTIDAVLLGGKYDTTDALSKVSVHYRKSIEFLGRIVQEKLGFDPKVIPGSFEGYGCSLDATIQTQTRKIWIDKNAEHLPELEELYQANDLKATEEKWRMATVSA